MANLITGQTGTYLSQDPRISLKNMIGNSATTTPVGLWSPNGTLKGGIRFATNFGVLDQPTIIIVEKMPELWDEQVLGHQRWRVNDYYRVQIYCTGSSAINNKWVAEQEIKRVIETNATYLQSVGIDIVLLDTNGFNEIYTSGVDLSGDITEAGKDDMVARSWARVKLIYDLIKQ